MISLSSLLSTTATPATGVRVGTGGLGHFPDLTTVFATARQEIAASGTALPAGMPPVATASVMPDATGLRDDRSTLSAGDAIALLNGATPSPPHASTPAPLRPAGLPANDAAVRAIDAAPAPVQPAAALPLRMAPPASPALPMSGTDQASTIAGPPIPARVPEPFGQAAATGSDLDPPAAEPGSTPAAEPEAMIETARDDRLTTMVEPPATGAPIARSSDGATPPPVHVPAPARIAATVAAPDVASAAPGPVATAENRAALPSKYLTVADSSSVTTIDAHPAKPAPSTDVRRRAATSGGPTASLADPRIASAPLPAPVAPARPAVLTDTAGQPVVHPATIDPSPVAVAQPTTPEPRTGAQLRHRPSDNHRAITGARRATPTSQPMVAAAVPATAMPDIAAASAGASTPADMPIATADTQPTPSSAHPTATVGPVSTIARAASTGLSSSAPDAARSEPAPLAPTLEPMTPASSQPGVMMASAGWRPPAEARRHDDAVPVVDSAPARIAATPSAPGPIGRHPVKITARPASEAQAAPDRQDGVRSTMEADVIPVLAPSASAAMIAPAPVAPAPFVPVAMVTASVGPAPVGARTVPLTAMPGVAEPPSRRSTVTVSEAETDRTFTPNLPAAQPLVEPAAGAAIAVARDIAVPTPGSAQPAALPISHPGAIMPLDRPGNATRSVAADPRQPIAVNRPALAEPAASAPLIALAAAIGPGPAPAAVGGVVSPVPTQAVASAAVPAAIPDVASVAAGGPADIADAPPAPAPAPTAILPAPAAARPAGQVFAAALHAAALADRRRDTPGAESGVAALAGAAPGVPPQLAQAPALDLHRPDWPARMIDHIEMLRDAADAVSTRIRISPDALGPVDIDLRRDGDQVHVHLVAQHPETRAILSDAQPQLASLAAERGVRLGQTSVGQTSVGAGGEGTRQQPGAGGQQGHRAAPTRPAPAPAHADDPETDDTRIA